MRKVETDQSRPTLSVTEDDNVYRQFYNEFIREELPANERACPRTFRYRDTMLAPLLLEDVLRIKGPFRARRYVREVWRDREQWTFAREQPKKAHGVWHAAMFGGERKSFERFINFRIVGSRKAEWIQAVKLLQYFEKRMKAEYDFPSSSFVGFVATGLTIYAGETEVDA